jgi:hypothetical protein
VSVEGVDSRCKQSVQGDGRQKVAWICDGSAVVDEREEGGKRRVERERAQAEEGAARAPSLAAAVPKGSLSLPPPPIARPL